MKIIHLSWKEKLFLLIPSKDFVDSPKIVELSFIDILFLWNLIPRSVYNKLQN